MLPPATAHEQEADLGRDVDCPVLQRSRLRIGGRAIERLACSLDVAAVASDLRDLHVEAERLRLEPGG